jgi:hypothetical protein
VDKPPHGETRMPIPGPGALTAAIRKARLEAAEQSDVVADLRGAELTRLEILQDALAEVFAQVPPEVDLFDTGLVPGARPRLFIDMLGFVEMAHDRRTYRFLRDTRHGRVTVVETEDVERVAAEVTAYVARRLVEREKALAAEAMAAQSPRKGATTRATRGPDTKSPAAADLPAKAPASDIPQGLVDGSWLRIATNALAIVFVVTLTLFLIAVAAHEWQRYG